VKFVDFVDFVVEPRRPKPPIARFRKNGIFGFAIEENRLARFESVEIEIEYLRSSTHLG
jgi:hypothetical protein